MTAGPAASYILPQLLFGPPAALDGGRDDGSDGGEASAGNGETAPPRILACSPGLTPEDAQTLARNFAEAAGLTPLSAEADGAAIGLFAPPPDERVLARSYYLDEERRRPIHHLLLLPPALVRDARGGLLRLVNHLRKLPAAVDDAPLLTPLPVAAAMLKAAARARALAQAPPLPLLLALLNAALSPAGLVIAAAPGQLNARLALVAALQALLPRAAPQLTFSASAPQPQSDAAQIRFYDGERLPDMAGCYRWGEAAPAAEFSAYPARLLRCWQDSEQSGLLVELKEIDRIAARHFGAGALADELAAIVERQSLADDIAAGGAVDIARLKALLSEQPPPAARHLPLYLSALLRDELSGHDFDEAALIARFMDARPALDRQLNALLEENLPEAPDAVYRFVRQRLQESPTPRWRRRLQRAAEAALRIAIDEGDGAIIAAWLQLIAREPAAFGLAAALREGIDAAIAPARQDGQLAMALFSIACHYAHDRLPLLLADEPLVAALPLGLAGALRCAGHGANGDAIDDDAITDDAITDDAIADDALDYEQLPRELLALALARLTDAALAREQPPAAIGRQGAAALWQLAVAGNLRWLPPPYRARRTVERWLAAARPPLRHKARLFLLRALFAAGRDEDFQRACANWGAPPAAELAAILLASGRPLPDALDRIQLLGQQGILAPLAERETGEALWDALAAADGNSESQLLVAERLAWWLETHPQLAAPLSLCWRLLAAAAAAEDPAIAHIALRRALDSLAGDHTAPAKAAALATAIPSLAWSAELRQTLARWWRRQLSAADLDSLRELAAACADEPALTEARHAARTVLALRQLIAGPDAPAAPASDTAPAQPTEAAAESPAIPTAEATADAALFATRLRRLLASLRALESAFAPLAAKELQFDERAASVELRARAGALSDEESAVLAKDCQELAQLLRRLAEQRTRASVIRSADELERRLLSGQQSPAGGAIDALKWIAGFWAGTHQRRDEEGD